MPQQKSLSEQLPLEAKTPLYPWLKRLLTILEPRFGALEDKNDTLDTAIELVREVALFRINEVLLPSVIRIQALTSLGFLVATSTNALALTVGPKTITIDPGTERDLFTPSPFISVEADDDRATFAIARRDGYDPKTGRLDFTILQAFGSTATKTAWTVSSSAGVSLVIKQSVTDAATSAANALASENAAKAARDAALAARDSAGTYAGQAGGSAASAAASAAAAQTWDPSKYIPRAGAALTGPSSFSIQDGENVPVAQRSGGPGASGLQIIAKTADGTSDAAMTFHRPGQYAVWFGLDTENEFVRGGWSDGLVKYKFWTAKNSNPNKSPRADIDQTFDAAEQRRIKANAGAAGAGYYGDFSQTGVLPATAIGKVVYTSGAATTITLPTMRAGQSIKLFNSAGYTKTIAPPSGGTLWYGFAGSVNNTYAMPPGATAIFECYSDDGSFFVFAGTSPNTVNPDTPQFFNKSQRNTLRRTQRQLGSQFYYNSGDQTQLTADQIGITMYYDASGRTFFLPPYADTALGEELYVWLAPNVQVTVKPATSDTNQFVYGPNSGGASAVLKGPALYVFTMTDSCWRYAGMVQNPVDASGAAFTGGISAPSLMVNGRAVYGPATGGTTGGNNSDLDVNPNSRLSYSFVATGNTGLLLASGQCSNSSSNAADIYWRIRLYDVTAGNQVVQDKVEVSYAAPVAGSTAPRSISMVQGGLTLGRTYSVSFEIWKGQAVGPIYPNNLQMQHIIF